MNDQNRPDIEQLLAALTREVVVGRTHLEIAKRLRTADTAVIATAKTFFTLTHNAHLYAAQMFAAKLHDKTKNAVTIRTMLDEAKRVAGRFKYESAENVRLIVGEARKQIEKFEEILRVLEDRRNEYLAHLGVNAVTAQNEIFDRAQLTFDELDELFVETLNILNDISQGYVGTFAAPSLPNSGDCETIFRIIADESRNAEESHQ